MQKITDERVRHIVAAQREDTHKRNLAAMHRVHNAPAPTPEVTDVDVQALLALLAPFALDRMR